ncbi:hypothetical protein ES703_101351 [subsurface metagenome]
MNSKLLFSSNFKEYGEQLHAYEVYSREIGASMMVLSACNTGSGKLTKGEGVFSIARAFLLAGVKNVIITQWSVADKSSASIMDRYYYYLSKGYPVDIALQESKADFLKKGDPVKAHPYYWASYVSIGNPIYFDTKSNRWISVLITSIVLLFAVFWIKRKLRF